jgi:hypothetical protein
MRRLFLVIALILATPASARESAPERSGEVRVPLSVYTAMLNQLTKDPRPAPAAYAIGQSHVVVRVSDREDRISAAVDVTVQIEIFEDEWTLVPILPTGAALRQASVDGHPVQLVESPDGLAWSTDQAGTMTMRLSYGVDAKRYETGFVLPLAVPRSAATAFSLTYPGTGIDFAVVPSADVNVKEVNGATQVTASVPATSSILVSWRAPSALPFAISRAHYSGELRGNALIWTGQFQVEVFNGESITLPIMPSSVTLSDIRVDGEPATVLVEGSHFATILQGRGMHQVQVAFQVPVLGDEGPPRARLQIPKIPVSRFELILPGQKEVKVFPGADVAAVEIDGMTKVTTFIPMSDSVVFTWTEAIPEDLRGQMRANASLFHAVHAEEGVLHVQGTVVYEITHGDANLLELEIPDAAQVNRIVAPMGGLSDWAVAASETEGRKKINIFLERPVTGEYILEVSYERLLGAGTSTADSVAVPLLSANSVHRQRGMIALLSGQEFTVKPVSSDDLSKVGENQLPAFIRNRIPMTVAHTYKYTEPMVTLLVAAVAPERKQGRFDAQIDTLISLGEVTMKGSATVEIDVKSGAIVDLRLEAPGNVNVLGVSGPSLRSHEVRDVDGRQVIDLEFTREMEGQFRIEVNYERIMDREASETAVTAISVTDAEVEHGRIAIEALTAVEVRAATIEQLSNLDINELPRQLVLKTTNPILLAYRYVGAKPPFKLALKITRHQEIDVQVAAIERADYKTLLTRDGLSVTTARLIVRNSRRQFLRLALPPGSQVWSVFVDGKPEKPAYASGGAARGAARDAKGDGSAILIRMINSAKGYPVDIVYATPVEGIEHLGTVSSTLPRPDMVVTHSRWDIFLPVGPRYQEPDSTMDLVLRGVRVNPRAVGAEAMARVNDASRTQVGQPLRITVPTQGVHFAFEKLYANQSSEAAAFSIGYVSAGANQLGLLLSAVGTVLLWIGILAIASSRIRLPRLGTVAAILSGVVLLIFTIGYLGISLVPASSLALFIAATVAAWWGVQRWRIWRMSPETG